MALLKRKSAAQRQTELLRRGLINPIKTNAQRAVGNSVSVQASAGRTERNPSQGKTVKQEKLDLLLDRFLNTLVAQSAVNRKMTLLKSDRGRIIYLQRIIDFAQNRATLREALSRQIEAANKNKDTSYARFLTNLSRAIGSKKGTLVPRELEVELMLAKKELEQKKEFSTQEFVQKMRVGKEKQSARRQGIREKYLEKLKESESYNKKSIDEKIYYLQSLLSKRRKTRIGRAATSIIEKEIRLLRKQKDKEGAKKFRATYTNADALLREAMRSDNPEIRKKLVRRAKKISADEKETLPHYANYIVKYGYLTPGELGRIYNFEEAKSGGNYFRAAKDIKGTRFILESNRYYNRLLSENPLKAGLYLVEIGERRRASALADRLEETAKSQNVMAAIKIRQRLQRTHQN